MSKKLKFVSHEDNTKKLCDLSNTLQKMENKDISPDSIITKTLIHKNKI